MGLFGGLSNFLGGIARSIPKIPTFKPPAPAPRPRPSPSPSPRSSTRTTPAPIFQIPKIPTIGIPKVPIPTVLKVNIPKVPIPTVPKVNIPKVPIPTVPKVSIPAIPRAAIGIGLPAAAGAAAAAYVLHPQGQTTNPNPAPINLAIPKAPINLAMPNPPPGKTTGNVIDDLINARDTQYDRGFNAIADGNSGKAAAELAPAAAADLILPLDLLSVGNKWISGRGDEITEEEKYGSLIDAGSIIAAPFTGGVSYAASRALKAGKIATKGGKTMTKVSGLRRLIPPKIPTPPRPSIITRTPTPRPSIITRPTTTTRNTIYRTQARPTITTRTTAPRPASPTLARPAASPVSPRPRPNTTIHTTPTPSKAPTPTPKTSGIRNKIGAGLAGAGMMGIASMIMGGEDMPAEYPTTTDPYYDPAPFGGTDPQYIDGGELPYPDPQIIEDAAAGDSTAGDYLDEYEDAGGHYPAPVEVLQPAENLAQDMTQYADGVPVAGDVAKAARRRGLALALIAGTALVGIFAWKHRKTITGKVKTITGKMGMKAPAGGAA